MRDFTGAGWHFPLELDRTGSVLLTSRDNEIEQSIWLILATAPGERPMRPAFGCAIHDHVFAHPDATTAGLIAYEVRASLARWEPRIEVDDVDITFDATDREIVYVDVRFREADGNDPRNLVFPFYVIPAEE